MKRNLVKWTTLVVFVGLMITSCVSLTAQTTSDSNIEARYCTTTSRSLPSVHISTACLGKGGEAISGGDYNDTHPGMAGDSTAGVFFAGYQTYVPDASDYFCVFASSNDWTTPVYWPDTFGFTLPRTDYKTGSFWGTMTPNQDPTTSGQVFLADATDPTNPQGVYWEWSDNNFSEFQNLHLAAYSHTGPGGDPGLWNFGQIALSGYNNYGGANLAGSCLMTYETSSAGAATISWLTGITNCVHAANDIDQVTNMSYAVWDRNPSGGNYQLLLRKDNFGVWDVNSRHTYVFNKQITDTGNLKYPDVAANNNTVLLVVNADKAGNQDVVCYRSTNGFSSFAPVTVANSGDDELYPQITILGNAAVCTYIKGTQIYGKVSLDNGANWGTEQLINTDDTVGPIDNNAHDLFGSGTYIYSVWNDARVPTNTDIYYNTAYTPAVPVIEIGTIAGAIGKVTMQITNTGTGDQTTPFDWSITVTGGILHKINVSSNGTIPSLNKSASVTVKTDKFIFGWGSINVQCTAKAASKTATGKVHLIFVKIT